jgi:hypothetical protein
MGVRFHKIYVRQIEKKVDNVADFCNKVKTHPELYFFGGYPNLVLRLPLERIDERRMRVWLREH